MKYLLLLLFFANVEAQTLAVTYNYIFKDFEKKQIFSDERLFMKIIDVEDDLDLFKWEIHKDTLTILNQKCFRATTTFRGRDYEAFFTEEIPLADGPWKFNGLPGLILKISLVNSDLVFTAEAVKLQIHNESTTLKNPYIGKEIMSFEKYK